jgi:MFS-type transporter involved in bile tolerance (Atg22 family)
MGYDRYLDKQVGVGVLVLSSSVAEMTLDASIRRFHNAWEFWAYNVVFGLFQAPYYAFSQTMMAELSPPGFDNMVCLTDSFLLPLLFSSRRL